MIPQFEVDNFPRFRFPPRQFLLDLVVGGNSKCFTVATEGMYHATFVTGIEEIVPPA
jgi:hypothetical protein